MEQSESAETQEQIEKIITSDSDPIVFNPGDYIQVMFHIQDDVNVPSDTLRLFVVDSYNKRYNLFRETTPEVKDPARFLHKIGKEISANNFYKYDALLSTHRAKQLAIAAGVVAAAGGATLLAIKRRKQ